jgi:hypothetical protein
MYIIVDTETGGIGLDKSLLTASFFIADDQFKVKQKLNLFLKPNDGVYHVDAGGLLVNKIDLVKHDNIAKTYKVSGTVLYDFLREWSQCGFNKLTVVGKNVYFDLTHIWDKLLGRGSWETFCSYQLLDLSSVWRWLEITGKVPKLESTSLGALAEYLEVEVGEPHTAYGDVVTTLNIARGIKERFS